MNTQRTILLIVLGLIAAATFGVAAALVVLGRLGLAVALAGAVVLSVAYRWAIGPWHRRWGATDAEASRVLAGDELVPDAAGSTRAVTIDAPATDVFPWILQIGFGRAGWYSYDWIDNDGQPSADRIDPDLAGLAVGDVIPMTPTTGFVVRSIDGDRHILVEPGRGRHVVGGDRGGPDRWDVSADQPVPAGAGPRCRGEALDAFGRPGRLRHGATHAAGHQGQGRSSARRPGRRAAHQPVGLSRRASSTSWYRPVRLRRRESRARTRRWSGQVSASSRKLTTVVSQSSGSERRPAV